MKERNCNFCTIIEDGLAWIIGWADGAIIGCCFSCGEYMDDENMVNELAHGAQKGFKDGTWIGHLDKKIQYLH